MTDQREPIMDVVLAEDDQEECVIFSDVLEQINIPVQLTTVKNGDLLMQLLFQHLPDLLFLDIHMPCKDGKQCIREIRANRMFDKLPVIVYTGMNNKEMISFFFKEGANYYLVKPDTMEALKLALTKVFQKFSAS